MDSWFAGKRFDLAFFHVPIWLTWCFAFLLPTHLREIAVPLWVWLVAVLAIDVGHVWSSIYRTYLCPVTRAHQRRALALTPLFCFVACFFLAAQSDLVFWRVLAYVAAYHFVKQQVGIAALYRARHNPCLKAPPELLPSLKRRLARLDKLAVYAATVCPLLWWHANLPRKFSWFVSGDFLPLHQWLGALPQPVYVLGSWVFYAIWIGALLCWLLSHLYYTYKRWMALPIGKILWILGTAVNWYLGLVYFDSDLIFTLTNVVAHGIPYFGLIGLYKVRKIKTERPSHYKPALLLFLIPVLFLALSEEYLWDFLIYRDNPDFFAAILPYWRAAVDHPFWRAFWIAVLSLPQTVHYVLDGFIWKMDGRNPDLKNYLLPNPTQSAQPPVT